ncbi:cora-like protein [Favolaschia claudopus]|uniref:Cora-like protein n=1 Tax=Favolaschia claudopus TaxID=2862362 RepID=A0AAW0BBL8_9AGAR
MHTTTSRSGPSPANTPDVTIANRISSSRTLRPTRRHSGIGSEPGVDPHEDAKYSHFKEKCAIQMCTYGSEDVSLTTLSNAEFVELMKSPSEEKTAQPLLRWINLGGLDWDVISALALRYDLHPLALEDILHEQGHNQSKADYYQKHLFLRILCHSVPTEEEKRSVEPDLKSEYPGSWAKSSRTQTDAEKLAEFPPEKKSKHRRFSALSGFRLAARQRQILRIATLKEGDRVAVKHEPMFIFLLREGTVISVRPTANLEFTEPVTERIQQHESVIRTSQDPAILVEALLDLIVDRILEVMDEYQDKIHQLEHDILMKPSMSTVRSLHILSGDLIMHKRTLEPIRSMLYGLRRYDRERCAAIGFGNDLPTNAVRVDSDTGLGVGVGATGTDQWQLGRDGYLSSKAKIYLADVYDHMDFVLTSLDMFAGISENLINYAFNMASYEMNIVMRRLTLATIIFLPLTLLTGYFGMNFTSMWSVDKHSDVLFWIIALPVMGIIVPMFLYSDIKNMFHYVHKVMAARRAIIDYYNADPESMEEAMPKLWEADVDALLQDWKSHRSECRKSLNALLFPADNAAPAMVQIPYTDKVDTDNSIPGYPSKPYHALDIQILRKYIANTLEMKYVTRMGSRGQPLTQPLVAMFSGDWEGLPRNQCVAHLAGQEVGVPWAGDVLVLRQKGKLYDETYESATMEDVKAMQRFRAEYRDFEPYGF